MAIPFTLADKSHVGPYWYYVTSERWKDICTHLPSFVWVEWPSYVSANRRVTVPGVDGNPTTLEIQCWKGWCGDFFQHLDIDSKISFPGGVGAEVGIYNPKKPAADDVFHLQLKGEGLLRESPFQPLIDPIRAAFEFSKYVREQAKQTDTHELWWADDEAVKATKQDVSFTFYDPAYDVPLLSKFSTDTYWTCKWMDEASYIEWRGKQKPKHSVVPKTVTTRTDIDAYDYTLEFSFAGENYIWPGSETKIHTQTEWRAQHASKRTV